MNKEDTINIDQLISKLKQMFDADDAACRAYEAFNRGEVPYEEFEINNEVRDMLWRELKENIDTFSKLSCSECKMYDVCDKSQRELNQFCSSFTASFKKNTEINYEWKCKYLSYNETYSTGNQTCV